MGRFLTNSFERTLGEMMARVQNPKAPLEEIGFLMAQEMKINIDEGGRPEPWPMSKRARMQDGQTLRDSGTLMNGMDSEVDGSTAAAGPTAVGRNKLSDPRIFGYLAYGSEDGTNPARDFTWIPPDRFETFGDIMARYVTGQ